MKKTISVAAVVLLLLNVSACTSVRKPGRNVSRQIVFETETEPQEITEAQETTESQTTAEPQETTEPQTNEEPQEMAEPQTTAELQETTEPQTTTELQEMTEPQTNEELQEMSEVPAEDEDVTEQQEEEAMRISVKSEQYEIIYELNGSTAAAELYAQLPLIAEVEPFSNNEMTFYPEKLDVKGTPLSGGETGSLAYYEPWGDVVLFYAPCTPNSSLYGLGTAVSGAEHIEKLSGTITVSAVEEM